MYNNFLQHPSLHDFSVIDLFGFQSSLCVKGLAAVELHLMASSCMINGRQLLYRMDNILSVFIIHFNTFNPFEDQTPR